MGKKDIIKMLQEADDKLLLANQAANSENFVPMAAELYVDEARALIAKAMAAINGWKKVDKSGL